MTTTAPKPDPVAELRALTKAARSKLQRSLPLEWKERAALNLSEALDKSKEILAEANEVREKNDNAVKYTQGAHNAARRAIRLLVEQMFILAASHAHKRQELEADVTRLWRRVIDLEERSPAVQGTFDPNKNYRALDVVAKNGAAFTAKCDNPGICPGPNWQLTSAQGKTGKPGPRVKSLAVNDQGMLTLTNADGSTIKCDLYPLLAKIQQVT